ncbi:MAG: cation:proton antiporter [Mesorhizobium sp.]|uniref:cation:proton antiporter n=2 Tax=Mesorhizobium sp. TaxID=1871066 RepID=UPI000FE3EF8A|nr:cation:proton antiporter [Mesorhizobium sp.]RWA77251.1 MAG: cation:proton antiporter [Mesorhizobium sp.]RWC01119.1 MAG: cation:proton antiporter [Mesorhizobium sp.]RWG84883.1 MAG: cation:proton antiporter [Mesorhizobium sp.]RWG90127.1 MAG: cation:proton antiporter [Mesorhizobium sp.]RWK05068.1 MAG: cation:proton antiporter [Mesorhizobium sp.]
MNDSELARFFLSLVVLLVGALGGGHMFERLKLPRVIGEIAGGIALGPSVLGLVLPDAHKWLFAGFPAQGALLSAFYWLGLVLLMFTAGFKMQTEGMAGSGRIIPALVVGALVVPFACGYLGAPLFADAQKGDAFAFKLVMGIAAGVTSIPVISRLFLDLGLMNSAFARNIIGAATIQDLILWSMLAIATAVQHGDAADAGGIGRVIAINLAFVLASLFVAPAVAREVRRRVFGKFSEASLTGYTMLLCLVFVAAASLLKVNIVFAALLAGLVMTRFPSRHLAPVKQHIADISIWFFVPIYFALVGLRLDLAHQFDGSLILFFIIASTAIKLVSCTTAARIAGTAWARAFDYGVAMNTRGGPGIVLASVAYAAGIIDERMFSALVLASILTSFATGFWLRWRLAHDPEVFAEAARPPAAPMRGLASATTEFLVRAVRSPSTRTQHAAAKPTGAGSAGDESNRMDEVSGNRMGGPLRPSNAPALQR